MPKRNLPSMPGTRRVLTIADTGVSAEIVTGLKASVDLAGLKARDARFLRDLAACHGLEGGAALSATRREGEATAVGQTRREPAIDALVRCEVLSPREGRLAARFLEAIAGADYQPVSHRGDVAPSVGGQRSSLARWAKAPAARRGEVHRCRALTFDPKPVKTFRQPGDGGVSAAAEAGMAGARARGAFFAGAMRAVEESGLAGAGKGGRSAQCAGLAVKVLKGEVTLRDVHKHLGGRETAMRSLVKTAIVAGLAAYEGDSQQP